MANENPEKIPFEDRIERVKEADAARALKTLREKIDQSLAAYLNACVHCGLCAESCHYYLAEKETAAMPAYKLHLVQAVFKKYFSLSGKLASGWYGAKELDREQIKGWIDNLFGRCSLCGRCTINCTVGINISQVIHAGRSALAAIDLVPPELQATVDTALSSGNNMGITQSDWLETISWLTDELRQEVGDDGATMPINEKNVKYLYTVNPREPKFFPLSLVAAAKIFYAAGESWTYSSDYYDVTNYGYFSGDDNAADTISRRLVNAVHSLGAKGLILGECGHGFSANRWDGPEWAGEEYGFEVKSIIQVIADYIRTGRIKLDPSRNKKTVTLHDPCNLVRLGGIIEEPRLILRNAVENFVEMSPNREKNYCCGGGGGQLSMTRYARRRLDAGRIKADQIRATGAKVVVAPCHNCIDQLSELNREYRLGVEIKSIAEVVAEAVILPGNKN
ncbi:conserved hypothetical protein [Candidatus Zixiibacteriota bacterium]|nr:conserved hypothetical protein [candidate division Zixibacteria bacterium]